MKTVLNNDTTKQAVISNQVNFDNFPMSISGEMDVSEENAESLLPCTWEIKLGDLGSEASIKFEGCPPGNCSTEVNSRCMAIHLCLADIAERMVKNGLLKESHLSWKDGKIQQILVLQLNQNDVTELITQVEELIKTIGRFLIAEVELLVGTMELVIDSNMSLIAEKCR